MRALIKIKSLTLTLVLCFTIMAYAQTEGVVKMTTTNAATKEKANVEWLMKDGNHKMIINGTADGNNINYVLLFPKGDPNGYMLTEVNGQKAKFDIPASALAKAALSGNISVRISEGTFTVNNFNCKKVIIESDDQILTVWVSTDLPITPDDLPAIMNKGNIMGLLRNNNVDGIPVKIIAKDASGQLQYTQDIESFTPTSVATSEFDMSGYVDGTELMKNAIQQNK